MWKCSCRLAQTDLATSLPQFKQKHCIRLKIKEKMREWPDSIEEFFLIAQAWDEFSTDGN